MPTTQQAIAKPEAQPGAALRQILVTGIGRQDTLVWMQAWLKSGVPDISSWTTHRIPMANFQ